jgi:hypothetical protein
MAIVGGGVTAFRTQMINALGWVTANPGASAKLAALPAARFTHGAWDFNGKQIE